MRNRRTLWVVTISMVFGVAALWTFAEKLERDWPSFLVGLAFGCIALFVYFTIDRLRRDPTVKGEASFSVSTITLDLRDVIQIGLIMTAVFVIVWVPQDALAVAVGAAMVLLFFVRILTRPVEDELGP
jgi:uncharacterized membrane protein YfcA